MQILKASDAPGGYTPNTAEKKAAILVPDKFKLSGDAVFHTLQGEGKFIGQPATFVRLNRCNLACSRCDTWYTRKKDEKEYYNSRDVSIEELEGLILESQIAKGVKIPSFHSIVFTGGEPMLQQKMIAAFMEKNPTSHIQIETNGTILVKHDIILDNSYFNCSPKLPNADNTHRQSHKPDVIKQLVDTDRASFKFVFRNKEDIDRALETYGSIVPQDKMLFMPEGVTKEESAAVFDTTIDYLIANQLAVTLRGQNIMRDGAKRGV